MSNYEDDVRRQMEEAANAQSRGECPVEGNVDAAFARSGAKNPFRIQGTRKSQRKAERKKAVRGKKIVDDLAAGRFQ